MEIGEDSLFHCFGCGVLVLNARGEISFANERAESILGGRKGWRYVSPEGEPLPPEETIFARLLAGATIASEELLVVRPDGGRAMITLNGAPVRSRDGGIMGAVIDFTDITASRQELEEIRRAKQQVEESQNRLRALVGSIDEIVFEFDAGGVYLNIWTDDDALLKRPREELLGRTVDQVLDPELGRIFLASIRRVLESGIPESLEYPLDVMGGERWFLARISPIPHSDGKRTVAFLARDITERKRIEEELRASEHRFHQILENINLATLILDPRGTIVYCNDFFLGLTGWARGEVQGRDWFEIFIPEAERHPARKRWLDAISGRFAGYHEDEIVTRQGQRRLMGWNTLIIRNGVGKPVGCASIAEDITERRRAEEVLRRSDQMKSDFISTAAHELRTPLTSIMGYAELLLKSEEFGHFPPEQRLDFAREIFAKSEVLNGIVNELLDLSRFDAGESIALDLVPCRLDDVLREEVERYRHIFPRHLFELSIETCPPDILVDRRRMEEVLENLLSNAAKYSPPGRCVRVRGRPCNGGYLVSVSDEGIGMTDEQVEHVFDKFYRADTSDTSLSGLGIGMSLVRNIIEAHGGRIWVESVPMGGTTVSFYLPPSSRGKDIAPPSASFSEKETPSRKERGSKKPEEG